jgi:hypothetical protein
MSSPGAKAALSLIAMQTACISIGGKLRFPLPDKTLADYSNAKLYFANVGWFNEKGRWIEAFPGWLRSSGRRNYKGLDFLPAPPGMSAPQSTKWNSWEGWNVTPNCEGTFEHFKRLISEGICDGDPDLEGYFWSWSGHMVQHPAELPGTALVIHGRHGSGKGTVADVIAGLVGSRHTERITSEGSLTGRFSDHLSDKLFIFADEACWAGSKASEGRLKAMVTEATLSYEAKGLPAYQGRNCARLIIATNSEWAVPTAPGERRFAVYHVAETFVGNDNFFDALRAEMSAGGTGALLYHLMHLNLAELPNPKIIPRTKALEEQTRLSLGSVDAFALECMERGYLVDHPKFRTRNGGWGVRVAVADLWQAYLQHTREAGHRYPATSSRALTKRLTELWSLSESSTTRFGNRTAQTRLFPTIEKAAASFAVAVGVQPELGNQLSNLPAQYADEEDDQYTPVDLDAYRNQTSTGMTGTNNGH